jgi:hypothetical protein
MQGLAGSGIYGMPGLGGGSRENTTAYRQRMATEQWEVAVGVPPVIKPSEPSVPDDTQTQVDEEKERFEEWYREISEPWTLHKARDKEGNED